MTGAFPSVASIWRYRGCIMDLSRLDGYQGIIWRYWAVFGDFSKLFGDIGAVFGDLDTLPEDFTSSFAIC
ncbi:hypothetical protein BACCIP111883_01710 [Sutcliffiella rhizosphaerae]|uniref:Uncharacterized protein n=2 Tax=Sutcliffiella rhizosphaerae TaxID=2880967 RepID=A0ABM8YLU4_9BACI|nr:hypothetical protein BACCIP111883_01710 [Sutcliffiella rhizosphaerae]